MRYLYLFVIYIFSITGISGQSAWSPEYYNQYNLNTFRSFDPFHDTIDIKNFDHRLANAAVFYVTNEIRKKKKLLYIAYNKNLEVAAYFHSKSMATKLFFNHINRKDSKRKTPNDRAEMAGIENPYAAENIVEGFVLDYIANKNAYPRGKGQFSYKPEGNLIPVLTYINLAELLLDAWMHSPPHKANIVSKNNLQLGCGVALYIDHKFNDMPMVKATQLFQQYELIETKKAVDTF